MIWTWSCHVLATAVARAREERGAWQRHGKAWQEHGKGILYQEQPLLCRRVVADGYMAPLVYRCL
jgi:hypothetical protein